MKEILLDFKNTITQNRLKLFCLYVFGLIFTPIVAFILHKIEIYEVQQTLTVMSFGCVYTSIFIIFISPKEKRKKLLAFLGKHFVYFILIAIVIASTSFFMKRLGNNYLILLFPITMVFYETFIFYPFSTLTAFMQTFFIYSFVFYMLILANDEIIKEEGEKTEEKFSLLSIWHLFSKYFSKKLLFFIMVFYSWSTIYPMVISRATIRYFNYGHEMTNYFSFLRSEAPNFFITKFLLSYLAMSLLICFLNSCIKFISKNKEKDKNKIDLYLEKKNLKFFGSLYGSCLIYFSIWVLNLFFVEKRILSQTYLENNQTLSAIIYHSLFVLLYIFIILGVITIFKIYFKYMNIPTTKFTLKIFLRLLLIFVFAYLVTFYIIWKIVILFFPYGSWTIFLVCFAFFGIYSSFQVIEVFIGEKPSLFITPFKMFKKLISPYIIMGIIFFFYLFPNGGCLDNLIFTSMINYTMLYLIDFYIDNRQ